MKTFWVKCSLTWPGMALCLFLQRTPALKTLVEVEFALAPRVLHVAKVFLTSAVSLGAYHTVTGATGDFQVTGALRGVIGQRMAVAVQAERATPRRVEFVGDLPPGLQTNQDDEGNVPNGTVLISGTPTQVGTFPVTLRVLQWGVPRAPVRELEMEFVISLSGPQFTKTPVSQRVVEGCSLRLEVELEDESGATYQWQKNTGSGFSNISGVTSRVYTVAEATAADEGAYRVVVTQNDIVAISPGGGDAMAFVTVQSGPAFQAWANRHFDDPEADSAGELGNPDGDALPNMIEFVFDLDPEEPDSDSIPAISTESIQGVSYGVFTFPSLRLCRGVQVTAETSPDLGPTQWHLLVHGVDGVILEQTDDHFAVKLPLANRLFSRLRIALTDN